MRFARWTIVFSLCLSNLCSRILHPTLHQPWGSTQGNGHKNCVYIWLPSRRDRRLDNPTYTRLFSRGSIRVDDSVKHLNFEQICGLVPFSDNLFMHRPFQITSGETYKPEYKFLSKQVCGSPPPWNVDSLYIPLHTASGGKPAVGVDRFH